jgi:hypothetical protein
LPHPGLLARHRPCGQGGGVEDALALSPGLPPPYRLTLPDGFRYAVMPLPLRHTARRRASCLEVAPNAEHVVAAATAKWWYERPSISTGGISFNESEPD